MKKECSGPGALGPSKLREVRSTGRDSSPPEPGRTPSGREDAEWREGNPGCARTLGRARDTCLTGPMPFIFDLEELGLESRSRRTHTRLMLRAAYTTGP